MRDGWSVSGGGRSGARSSICGTSFSRPKCSRTTRGNLRISCVFTIIQLPIKTLLIDGNCRVEDRGLKMHHGHMAAFNIQEALIWKEKIELVIDQQDFITANGNKVYASIPYGPMADDGRNASSSDRESQCSPEEEEESRPTLSRRITIGNGFPDSVPDWTCDVDSGLLSENNSDQVFSRKHWRLVRCQNGLCGLVIYVMCVIGDVMMMEVMVLAVVLFRSREHVNCSPQPGFVRAHVESGGFKISPLKTRNGRLRTQVQYLMQIDLKGWGVGYFPSFQQHCLIQMLNSVAGLREWFSQTDENYDVSKMPLMVNMTAETAPIKKDRKRKTQENSVQPNSSQYQMHGASRHHVMLDEDSYDDEDYKIPEPEQEVYPIKLENEINKAVLGEEPSASIDLSGFSGNLRRDDLDKSRNCWRISDGNNFRVRSKQFIYDKTKIPAGKHLMELVAVDWFKDVKRIDHVARRKGCAVQVASEKGLFSLVINVQVPASTHYSMVFYFVSKPLVPGSLLQLFVDGDDEYRNSRFKLIPAVPKGSWIVRQSVGSTPCLLGKAVDCTYIRGPDYLEIDVDIGSSTVANGVLGLVFGVITTLVVDMAFLVQANTYEDLPERLIGAVRVSHVELSSAQVPVLEASDPNV
ncbi:protein ENHANCED DISEASE RESISTANCE 2-like isoform X3 [Musa acuminata AAA Group]|uniref:protein ENHANCED DISEASE RESISTANCE 2-like isoform X3 n=1 Tax=Musa acuminata AAA Group TaxID=214697 RepID=UPI0031D99EA0